jgi:hypothetical protein
MKCRKDAAEDYNTHIIEWLADSDVKEEKGQD